jgi:hypothetical protein
MLMKLWRRVTSTIFLNVSARDCARLGAYNRSHEFRNLRQGIQKWRKSWDGRLLLRTRLERCLVSKGERISSKIERHASEDGAYWSLLKQMTRSGAGFSSEADKVGLGFNAAFGNACALALDCFSWQASSP